MAAFRTVLGKFLACRIGGKTVSHVGRKTKAMPTSTSGRTAGRSQRGRRRIVGEAGHRP